MTTPTEAAAQRIRAYVIARAKTRVLSHDAIHTLVDWSDDTPSAQLVDVILLVSDLCLLVDAVLDPDEPTPQDEIDAARIRQPDQDGPDQGDGYYGDTGEEVG